MFALPFVITLYITIDIIMFFKSIVVTARY